MECIFCEEDIGNVEFPICRDCNAQIILDALTGGETKATPAGGKKLEKRRKRKKKKKNEVM